MTLTPPSQTLLSRLTF